ncbi:hypothetical protein [Arthrobacter sp. ZGTC131]|uniref:hypothetical protein n=1 Tax=Arthrobacter sp. ZGTC131 TaxID=2058898 RepID=UPI000CE4668B|nr:hypothetical protein [Arthrobacter sp. ZGTC131]
MTLQTERTTIRSAETTSVLRAPRGGSYVTPSSRVTPTGTRDSERTEGSYISTPGGTRGNGNRVQGRYVTLPAGRHDETEGSYVSAS